MRVFIDTNIFLSFYHLSNEDIDELRKLIVLIENDEIDLMVSEQVVEETWRNRAGKIADGLRTLRNQPLPKVYPIYCKGYEEYAALREKQKEFSELHNQLLKNIQEDISSRSLAADKLLTDLFKVSKTKKRTDKIISKARLRAEIGNPPGKKGSLRDAINWETLLETMPKSLDLHLIAADSDYASPLDDTMLNEFLSDEWRAAKNSEVHFYTTLTSFTKEHFKHINLKTEKEKDTLIGKLLLSGSFTQTHAIISELQNFDIFTIKQAENLFTALALNSQVNWIVNDDDVHAFFKNLFDHHFGVVLGHDHTEEIFKLLSPSKASPSELDNDIPF